MNKNVLTPKSYYSLILDLERGLPALLENKPFESESTEISTFLPAFLSTLEHFITDYIPTGLILKEDNTNIICGIGRHNNISLVGIGPSKIQDPYYLHYN